MTEIDLLDPAAHMGDGEGWRIQLTVVLPHVTGMAMTLVYRSKQEFASMADCALFNRTVVSQLLKLINDDRLSLGIRKALSEELLNLFEAE